MNKKSTRSGRGIPDLQMKQMNKWANRIEKMYRWIIDNY